MVEDYIIADSDFTRVPEYLEILPEKAIIAYKRVILNKTIKENETNSEIIHRNMCAHTITEASNSNDSENSESSSTANSAEGQTTATQADSDNIFNFLSNIPTDIFKLNNLGTASDWRKEKQH